MEKSLCRFFLSFICSFIFSSNYFLPEIQDISFNTVNCYSQERNGFIYVGVLTTVGYLQTRGLAVWDTWAKSNIPIKIEFFVGGLGRNKLPTAVAHLPIVELPHVTDNTYPAQKKSFFMINYMYRKYNGKFKWFMRADDDTYVKLDKLEAFLRQLDENTPLLIGQTGLGNKEEFGQLSLNDGENYCMGGPGIVLSSQLLDRVGSEMPTCLLNNLYTSHEDVEFTRCIRKIAHVNCVWSYDLQKYFYQNYDQTKNFIDVSGNEAEVNEAITLHPNKHPQRVRQLHHYFVTKRIEDHTGIIVSMRKEATLAGYFSKTHYYTNKSDPKIISPVDQLWSAFDEKFQFPISLAKHKLSDALRNTVTHITAVIIAKTKLHSAESSRHIKTAQVNHGFTRIKPAISVEYRFNVTQQNLTQAENFYIYSVQNFLKPAIELKPESSDRIHVIVPLKGRLDAMTRFLDNIEREGRNEDMEVLIVLFKSPDNLVDYEYKDSMESIKLFQTQHPLISVVVYPIVGRFSRAVALETGIRLVPMKALVLFCDVDVVIKRRFFTACRNNAQLNKSAFFPILFSQYNPAYSFAVDTASQLEEHRGYWRDFGFGLACLYKKDYFRVGGFDRKIKGWGKEDIDLYGKFIYNGYAVIRTRSPHLFHQFHPQNCSGINESQRNMCHSTKYSNYASQINLATRWQLSGNGAAQIQNSTKAKIVRSGMANTISEILYDYINRKVPKLPTGKIHI